MCPWISMVSSFWLFVRLETLQELRYPGPSTAMEMAAQRAQRLAEKLGKETATNGGGNLCHVFFMEMMWYFGGY